METYNETQDIILVETAERENFLLMKTEFHKKGINTIILFQNKLFDLLKEIKAFNNISDSELREMINNNDKIVCDNGRIFTIYYPGSNEKISKEKLKLGFSELDIGKRVTIKNLEEYFVDNTYNPFRDKVGVVGILTAFKRGYRSNEGYYFYVTISYIEGSVLSLTIEGNKVTLITKD